MTVKTHPEATTCAGLVASWDAAQRRDEVPVNAATIAGALLAESDGDAQVALLLLEDVRQYLQLVTNERRSFSKKVG